MPRLRTTEQEVSEATVSLVGQDYVQESLYITRNLPKLAGGNAERFEIPSPPMLIGSQSPVAVSQTTDDENNVVRGLGPRTGTVNFGEQKDTKKTSLKTLKDWMPVKACFDMLGCPSWSKEPDLSARFEREFLVGKPAWVRTPLPALIFCLWSRQELARSSVGLCTGYNSDSPFKVKLVGTYGTPRDKPGL